MCDLIIYFWLKDSGCFVTPVFGFVVINDCLTDMCNRKYGCVPDKPGHPLLGHNQEADLFLVMLN